MILRGKYNFKIFQNNYFKIYLSETFTLVTLPASWQTCNWFTYFKKPWLFCNRPSVVLGVFQGTTLVVLAAALFLSPWSSVDIDNVAYLVGTTFRKVSFWLLKQKEFRVVLTSQYCRVVNILVYTRVQIPTTIKWNMNKN